jgi:hypothetical protein
MTSVTPHSCEAVPPPPVACIADGGCSYLRTLSTIERLAGFDQTAHSYARAALRCQHLGCWAAEESENVGAQQIPSCSAPVTLDSVRPTRDPAVSAARKGVAAPIPFVRSALVDTVSDGDGNYVERRSVKLEILAGCSDPLGYLYQYWCGLRAETECRFANIDPVHLMRAGIIGKMHIIDVSSGDPEDFRFELAGYAVPMSYYERPRAFPIKIYADATLRDYNTARLTATPRLHRVRCRLGDTYHHYTRLILPLLNSSGRVGSLLVAVRLEPGEGLRVQPGD